MTDSMPPAVRQYLTTALWSTIALISEEECDQTFDALGYLPDDCAPALIAQATADLAEFRALLPDDLADRYTDEDLAHDLWLTRERHGAGFWDGDYPDPDGRILTDLARSLGEVNLYLGDDGLIYSM